MRIAFFPSQLELDISSKQHNWCYNIFDSPLQKNVKSKKKSIVNVFSDKKYMNICKRDKKIIFMLLVLT